jgi:hypothetical protein
MSSSQQTRAVLSMIEFINENPDAKQKKTA